MCDWYRRQKTPSNRIFVVEYITIYCNTLQSIFIFPNVSIPICIYFLVYEIVLQYIIFGYTGKRPRTFDVKFKTHKAFKIGDWYPPRASSGYRLSSKRINRLLDYTVFCIYCSIIALKTGLQKVQEDELSIRLYCSQCSTIALKT